MSKEIKKHKGTLITYYMAPCFGYRRRRGMYWGDYVGTVDDCLCTWNGSSPLAKKEYDRKYKLWGRLVIAEHGDD